MTKIKLLKLNHHVPLGFERAGGIRIELGAFGSLFGFGIEVFAVSGAAFASRNCFYNVPVFINANINYYSTFLFGKIGYNRWFKNGAVGNFVTNIKALICNRFFSFLTWSSS